MSDWYQATGQPDSDADAADLRAEFLLVQQKFSDQLPTLTGNAGKVIAVNSSGDGLEALSAEDAFKLIRPVTIDGVKTSDTTRDNSVSIAADPHLSVSLEAGKVYLIDLALFAFKATSGGTATLVGRFEYSGTLAEYQFGDIVPVPLGSGSAALLTASAFETQLTFRRGLVRTSTAGDLTFWWTSNRVTPPPPTLIDIDLEEGSYLRAREIVG